MTANLTFLCLVVLLCCNFSFAGLAQEETPVSESNDPIRESIVQNEQKLEGANLTAQEYNQLARINKKYQLSPRDKKLQVSYKDTLNIMARINLARSYRKQYMLTKKVEKFRKKKVESNQSPRALERMRESEKRTKARYKKRKREARRRKFLNLFK